MPSDKEKLLEKARKCFKLACEAEAKQRERELEDLAFQIPENQWSAEAREQRRGGIIGGQVVPGRPMLSISLLTQPLQLIQNQAANAHLGVEIHPVSEDAETELAEIKQGLYRRIERDSNADQARLWALDRAKQAGRGWYRINTQYDEDGDDPLDQEIVIERIFDQHAVYIDPGAQKPDFSDAEWGMIVAWMDVDQFKDLYPDADVPANETEFQSWHKEEPNWVRGDGEKRAVLVAEYFYKVHERKKYQKAGQVREMDIVSVRWCKITAKNVLEESDWAGKYIPLVPVVGRELQPFDGERRWEGIVRQARDGQQLFNFAASNLVEVMALEPKAPWIMAEGQEEGHEDEWKLANIRNMPYLLYKPTTIGGTPAPPPARAQADASKMGLALQALQQGKQFVQTATSVYEPSLGEMPSRRDAQSGRAILALQQQSDAGTGHFLHNLAKISMAYEARVILDLMPAIYDRPGRITQVLGAEDEAKMVMLGAPFVQGQDGRPQPFKPQPGMPLPQEVKQYDLSKGKYAISVSVGKSYQTRLQEGQAEIGEVLKAQPALMPLIGATYFRFRDFPGSKEIADILKKVRDKQFPGLDDKEQLSPEQLQAKLQAAEQQIQEMGQQLQAAAKALETDQAKQQATLQKADMDNRADMQKAEMDNATKVQIAQMQAQVDLAIAQLRAAIDEMKAERSAEMQERQGMRDSVEAEKGREHDAVMVIGGGSAPEPPESPEYTPPAEND